MAMAPAAVACLEVGQEPTPLIPQTPVTPLSQNESCCPDSESEDVCIKQLI